MLAELQTIDLSDVTLTQTMIILGVVPMVVVQLFRAVIEHVWPAGPGEIKKPLYLLVAIGITVLMFYAMATKDWLVGGIIIGLTSVGGYEFTKNMGAIVKKKVPNGTGTAVTFTSLLLCFLLLTGGCFNQNPRANLLASQKSFTATVDSLTALQQAGKFNAEETENITLLIHSGQRYLSLWKMSLTEGRDNPTAMSMFQEVLNQLIEYQVKKGGDL